MAFYRVCQEALNNIAKHAKASRVEIELVHEHTAVELQIRDDGLGFEWDGPGKAGHYGLSMMHERAESVRALLTITSQPGQGTTLRMRWTKDAQKEVQ